MIKIISFFLYYKGIKSLLEVPLTYVVNVSDTPIWNTVYLEKAVEYQKKYKGIDENLLKHISPSIIR